MKVFKVFFVAILAMTVCFSGFASPPKLTAYGGEKPTIENPLPMSFAVMPVMFEYECPSPCATMECPDTNVGAVLLSVIVKQIPGKAHRIEYRSCSLNSFVSNTSEHKSLQDYNTVRKRYHSLC